MKKELADSGNPEAVFFYKKIGVLGVTAYDAIHQSIKTLKTETGKFAITPGNLTFSESMKTPENVLAWMGRNKHITISEMADSIGISVKV